MTIGEITTETGVQKKNGEVVDRMLVHERLFVSLKLHFVGYAKAFENDGLEYYFFNCSKHGRVIAYPNGHDAFLACPKCEILSATDIPIPGNKSKSLSIKGVESS